MAVKKPKTSIETKLARWISGGESDWTTESVAKDHMYHLLRTGQKDEVTAEKRQERWDKAYRLLRPGISFIGLVSVRRGLDDAQASEVVEALADTDMHAPNIDIAIGGIQSPLSSLMERHATRVTRRRVGSVLKAQNNESELANRAVDVFSAPFRLRRVDLLDMARDISFNERLMHTRGDVIAHLVVVPQSDAIDFGASSNQQNLGRLQLIDRIGPDCGDIYWRTV